ncbi:DUF6126 family protein [Streptomyces sp. NPDC001941]
MAEDGAQRIDAKKLETKFPRGLVIRLFAYLVAGHLFAAFLYLIFTVGEK